MEDLDGPGAECPQCGVRTVWEASAPAAQETLREHLPVVVTEVIPPPVLAPVITPPGPAPVFHGPPVNCAMCGGALGIREESPSQIGGCFVVIVGLALVIWIIGIPIVVAGLYFMSQKKRWWVCTRCGHEVPKL